MNALKEIAAHEGLFSVRLLLQIAALKLEIKVLEREGEELKARLQAVEGGEHP